MSVRFTDMLHATISLVFKCAGPCVPAHVHIGQELSVMAVVCWQRRLAIPAPPSQPALQRPREAAFPAGPRLFARREVPDAAGPQAAGEI